MLKYEKRMGTNSSIPGTSLNEILWFWFAKKVWRCCWYRTKTSYSWKLRIVTRILSALMNEGFKEIVIDKPFRKSSIKMSKKLAFLLSRNSRVTVSKRAFVSCCSRNVYFGKKNHMILFLAFKFFFHGAYKIWAEYSPRLECSASSVVLNALSLS